MSFTFFGYYCPRCNQYFKPSEETTIHECKGKSMTTQVTVGRYTFTPTHEGNYFCNRCNKLILAEQLSAHNCQNLPKVSLDDVFNIPKPSKTLKLEPKAAQSLGSLTESAQFFLNSQSEYTKVEFKYDRNYIVIAKLKD